jgi:hypothetical protein
MNDDVSISDLIRYARGQLHEASQARRDANERALFRVESMTIEVHVVATHKREGKGGIDLRVLTIGGQKNYEHQQVHKITMTLRAKAPDEPEYGDDLEEEE